jgi:queuine tRNA-ribosyltransferase
MRFELDKISTRGGARAGRLTTDHGLVETPIFMPVGTQGTVKYVNQLQLAELGAQIILGNTYHLFLRPGPDLIHRAGGLHRFISWPGPILTDSGGYQVYSLSNMRKITEEGVKFNSPVDGAKHFFSPEFAIDVQLQLGADIIMAFDECTPYPCSYEYARESMKLTHRWLDRCIAQMDSSTFNKPYKQVLAPIVQGSTYMDLRKESALYIAEKEAEINAIGGLSVGEPAPIMYEMTADVCNHLPQNKARYLMGVGTPANVLECIDLGVDMFDCVMPTRNARHGLLYTTAGIINIRNAKWKNDFSPIDENLESVLSNRHSKAYLRHLFNVKEALGCQIASIHNLTFYLWLVREARQKILNDEFAAWKEQILPVIDNRI